MAQRRGQAAVADPLDDLIAGIDRTLAPTPAPRAQAPPVDLDALIGNIDRVLAAPPAPRPFPKGANAGGTFTGPVRVTEPQAVPRPAMTAPGPAVPPTPAAFRARGVSLPRLPDELRTGAPVPPVASPATRTAPSGPTPVTQRTPLDVGPAAVLGRAGYQPTPLNPTPPEPSGPPSWRDTIISTVRDRVLPTLLRTTPATLPAVALRGVTEGVEAAAGAFSAIPTAIGETLFEQPLPGHAEEGTSLLERLNAHAKQIVSGEGGAVAPMGVPAAMMNPPDTRVPVITPSETGNLLPQWRTRGAMERTALTVGQRGLDMAASLLSDPTAVAAMGVGGAPGRLLGVAFSANGIKAAAETASNPQATSEDVATAIIGAAIATIPLGVHEARAGIRSAATKAREYSARVAAEREAARTITPEPTDILVRPEREQIPAEAPIAGGPPEPPAITRTPVTPRTPPPAPPSPDALIAQIDQVLEPANVPVPELGPDAVTPAVYTGSERRGPGRIATAAQDRKYQDYRERYAQGATVGTEEARADFAERQRAETERKRLGAEAAVRDLEQATPQDLVDHIDTVLQEGGHASTEPSYAESRGDRGTSPGAVVREEPQPPAHVETATPRLREHPGEAVAAPGREDADHPQTEAVVPEVHKFSSTQVDLPTEVATKIRSLGDRIPDTDLAADGREQKPHVTVKYGLHTKDAESVRRLLANEPPITVTLGKTSHFADVEDGTADAVLVDVDSPDLHRLNAKIAQALEVTDTHPEYKPHATIAYVKRGLGKQYAGNAALEGQTVTLNAITFSSKDGSQTVIPLGGATTETRAEEPSTRATPITPKPRVKPPKLTGDAATWVGPQQVGGRYRSGYWGKEYTVESIARDERGAPKSMTIRWEDGDVTTHQTAWDRRHDKVLQQPAAPAGEAPKTPSTPKTEALAETPKLALQVGDNPNVRAVESIEEAARLVDQLRDAAEQAGEGGVSQFPKTTVVDTRTGKPVAIISYNGRIWDATNPKVELTERPDGRGYGKPTPIASTPVTPKTEVAPPARVIEKPAEAAAAKQPAAKSKARLQIREGDYRDKPGFHITGNDATGRPVRIFTETRASAEHIKAKLQRGEDTTVADFEIGKPAPPTPVAAAASSTTDIETSTEAATDVLAEVRRVVDTKGAKSAGEIQQRVLSALEDELKTAPNTQGYTTLEVRRTKAYGGREGSVWVDGDPVASYDRYGTLKWNDEASAYTEQRNGVPHYVPAVPSKRDTVHLGRDLTAGEMEKAARAAVANVLSQGSGGTLTLDIPGDGTFTIQRNTVAIQGVIDRIRKGGVAAWHGIVLKGPTPKIQPKFDRPWGTLPVSGRVKKASGGGNVSSMASPPPPMPPPLDRTPVTPSAQMRPSEIVKALHEGFGKLPISTGHFRQRAVGIFKTDPQAIRTRIANDLPTVFHEVGHYLDRILLGIQHKDPRWKDELIALGQATSRPSYSFVEQRREGAAEFFRLYLLDPGEAKRQAPAYFTEFERTLALPEHAEAAAVVRDVQQRVEGYLSQDLATRGAMRIDTTGGGPSMPSPRDLIGALSRAWIDDLQAIRDAVEAMRDGRDLPFAKNAYVLARISRGSAAKAEAFLEHGVRARNGQFVGPSFADAISPVRHALEEFGRYLVALRVKELEQRNIETGITGAEAIAMIRKAQARQDFAEFELARDNVYAYQDATLEYARQYKAASPEQIAAIKKLNQFYVPFQRVKDVGQARTMRARKYASRTVPIKRIHGSGLDIVNPFESIIRNTFAIVDMVEKNRAMLALTEQASSSAGSARWLEKVNPIEAQRVLVGRALDAMNPDARELLEAEGLDVDRLVTVFNPRQTPLPGQHIVTVIRNGKPEFWQIHDEDLYDAVTAIGPRMTSTLMEWAEKPVRLLRAGATLTPGFIARNPTRDSLVAFMQSRYGFVPGLDTVRGIFGILLHDPDAVLFDTSGVRQASLVGADTDRRRARQAISHLTARSKAELFRRIVFHPIDLLRMVSELMEAGTRLGEFKLALEAGGKERGIVRRLTEGNRRTVSEETLTQATLAARDVTTDFSRGGSVSREMNRFWAFFNARVQGYVRMFESAKRDPGGTAGKLLALALVSWFLWWLNEDDDEYHSLEDWERNSYWHIRIGKKFAKVAKPFEWGYLPNVIEAGLDYVRRQRKDGDPHAAKALDRIRPDKDTARKAVFGLMPSAVAPALEAAFNYATFRDQYIVQPWNLGLDPELQYSEWTTETAKGLGTLMGVSPAKIDHVIFGYTAGFGRGVVEWGSDPLLRRAGLAPTKNPPTAPSQRTPLVGVFVREAAYSSSSQDIEDFYEQYEQMQGYQASATRYLKAGDHARAEARKAEAAKEPFFTHSAEIKVAAAAFKEVGKEIDRIYKAPAAAMTPQQKREALDQLYERMVDVARKALGRPGLKALAGKAPVTATGTR